MKNTQLWIVDQISDEVVTVEVDGERHVTIPRELFPKRVKEGEVYRFQSTEKNGKVSISISRDKEFEIEQLERSKEQVSEKSDWDKGGDIVL